MGVSIQAYSGVQLEKSGGSRNDVDGEVGLIFLESLPGLPQSYGLETGLYSYISSYEESLGSYAAFEGFRQRLAYLAGSPYPGTLEDRARWKEIPFGELLYVADNHAILSPEAVQELAHSMDLLESETPDLFERLADEDFESYQILRKAVDETKKTFLDGTFSVIVLG